MDTTLVQSRARFLMTQITSEQRVETETANVLAVGQSPRDRTALSACFRGAMWRLMHAENIRSALDLLAHGKIHAVISDVHLPDGGWLDLHETLEAGQNRLPTIVATEVLDARLWAEALSHGAYDVLVKPFQPEEVLYVVQTACSHRLGMK